MNPIDWTPAFAGETNVRHRPFSSFRRKPESSGLREEFDVYTITALLVRVNNVRSSSENDVSELATNT